MTRILVIGCGCIGAVYIKLFCLADVDVTALCRSNFAAIKSSGISVRDLDDTKVTVYPRVINQITDESENYDFIVICTKAIPYETASIVETMRPAVGANSSIVLIQNGIDIEQDYAKAFPHNTIVSSVVFMPVSRTGPCAVIQKAPDDLHVGSYPASAGEAHQQRVEQFAEIIRKADGTVTVHADIQATRWWKILFNGAWNPVCALTRSRDVQFLGASPLSADVIWSIMMEIAAVAQASGYPEINEAKVQHNIQQSWSKAEPGTEMSMQADAVDGRPMEVYAILGSVVDAARRLKVETPSLNMLYALLSALDASNRRDAASKL